MPDEAVVVAEELDGKRLLFSLLFSFLGVTIKMNLTQKKTQAGPAAAGEKELSDGLNTPKSIMCFGVGEGVMEAGVLIDCSA